MNILFAILGAEIDESREDSLIKGCVSQVIGRKDTPRVSVARLFPMSCGVKLMLSQLRIRIWQVSATAPRRIRRPACHYHVGNTAFAVIIA